MECQGQLPVLGLALSAYEFTTNLETQQIVSCLVSCDAIDIDVAIEVNP